LLTNENEENKKNQKRKNEYIINNAIEVKNEIIEKRIKSLKKTNTKGK